MKWCNWPNDKEVKSKQTKPKVFDHFTKKRGTGSLTKIQRNKWKISKIKQSSYPRSVQRHLWIPYVRKKDKRVILSEHLENCFVWTLGQFLSVCLHILQSGWTGWETITWEKISFSNTSFLWPKVSTKNMVRHILTCLVHFLWVISQAWMQTNLSTFWRNITLHLQGNIPLGCGGCDSNCEEGGSSMGGWGASSPLLSLW